MTTDAAAHIITADATTRGEPAIIVMTRDEGMGATEIERIALPGDAFMADAWTALGRSGWTAAGAAQQVEYGYNVVAVVRA